MQAYIWHAIYSQIFFEKPKHDELVEEILHMESNIQNIDVMSPS